MKYFVLLIVISFSYNAFGQTSSSAESKRNTLYLECLGTSLTPISINYDRILLVKPNYHVNVAAGIGYFPLKNMDAIFGIPVTLNFSFGQKSTFLELGTGLTYNSGLEQKEWLAINDFIGTSSDVESIQAVYWTFRFGFKYQKRSGGIFFRIGFTPVYRIVTINDYKAVKSFYPAFGAAIGYTLK